MQEYEIKKKKRGEEKTEKGKLGKSIKSNCLFVYSGAALCALFPPFSPLAPFKEFVRSIELM